VALTAFQRDVIRTVAAERRRSGRGYIAGGAALNALIGAPRVSEDVDLFHDTADAVHTVFERDRSLLQTAGMLVDVRREWPTFVEADVERRGQTTRLQWAQESAFRFFPLVEHDDLGLTLHPFDLATNKILALIGRAEPRDWVDVIECDARIQPLGYLVWAAAGKDPGLSPAFILNEAARTGRYTAEELAPLAFEGDAPSAEDLAHRWRTMLARAHEVAEALPAREVGTCVCEKDGTLMHAGSPGLSDALRSGDVLFHRGKLYGAYPAISSG
jgi:hypothetical protein